MIGFDGIFPLDQMSLDAKEHSDTEADYGESSDDKLREIFTLFDVGMDGGVGEEEMRKAFELVGVNRIRFYCSEIPTKL